MSERLEICLKIALLVAFPYALHLGVLGGADVYPKPLNKNRAADRLVFKYLKYAIAFNGGLLAAFGILWEYGQGNWWIVPLIVGIPTVIVQLWCLGVAKSEYALKRY